MLLVFLAIFLLFGPKKIPEVARQMGKIMNDLKKTTSDLTRDLRDGADQVKREVEGIKSGVLAEATKLTSQLTESGTGFQNEANQLVSSIQRDIPSEFSGRNQAEVFRQSDTYEIPPPTEVSSRNTVTDKFPAAS